MYMGVTGCNTITKSREWRRVGDERKEDVDSMFSQVYSGNAFSQVYSGNAKKLRREGRALFKAM